MSEDWDENDFKDRLSNLERTWRSAEKGGRPRSEAEKTWGRLSLELEFSGLPPAEFVGIAWSARQWMETKNPHYIDAALLACVAAGISPPPALLGLMTEVATIRFAGLARGGTGKRIRDDGIQAWALSIICCLHLAGASVELAASKAARYIADQKLGKVYKASTLEREYAKCYREGNPSLEDEMRDGLKRATEETRRSWARLVSDLPEADEALKGNRRL